MKLFSQNSAYISHVVLNLIEKQFSLYFWVGMALDFDKKKTGKNGNLKQYTLCTS